MMLRYTAYALIAGLALGLGMLSAAQTRPAKTAGGCDCCPVCVEHGCSACAGCVAGNCANCVDCSACCGR